MLNLNLDAESEKYLIEILAHEQTTSSELIKQLLRDRFEISAGADRFEISAGADRFEISATADRWQALQSQQTTLERMGGYPDSLLAGPSDLSDRDVRKKLITEHLQKRHEQQS